MGGERRHQGLRGPRLFVAERLLLERLEGLVFRQRFVVAQPAPARRGLDQGVQLRQPAGRLVVVIPQRGDDAARFQHPGHLRIRPVEVEPVDGLADDHCVHGAVRQRDLLGRPDERGHGRERLLQFREHLLVRLHRGDLDTQPEQAFADLAGPRREIEYPYRRVPGAYQPPGQCLFRIVRPVRGIGGRSRAERGGAAGVQFGFDAGTG